MGVSAASYNTGSILAYLQPNQAIPAPFRFYPVLELTNRAFRIYRDARRTVDQAPTKLKWRMFSDLVSAAGEGVWLPGLGPGDLYGAFKHLEENNGKWVDETFTNYCGPHITGALNAPRAITNWLCAVDKRAGTLEQAYKNFDAYARQAAAAKSAGRWKEIGEAVDNIQKGAEWAEPCLWVAGASRGIQVSEKLMTIHGAFGKWVEAVGDIHSFASKYLDAAYGGTSSGGAAALAALGILFKKALPILGDVYAGALECVPALIRWAQNIRDERELAIARAMGGR
ncbi:MAG: hypothetical protein LC126_25135 [Bryobacterales bacterium]|nr:hypothetical protein [Bryobacterales bacterium]